MNTRNKLIAFIGQTEKTISKLLAIPQTYPIAFAISLVITTLAMLALNLLYPLFTDDWEYSFCERMYDYANRHNVTDERITSLWDIISSQYRHYFSWGGRSVNHVIAQILLLIGSPLNKILNSVAFTSLVYVIYILTKKKDQKFKTSSFITIVLLIFFFIPVLGATTLWITGSANYLWGTLIVLLFLVPYKNYCDDADCITKSNSVFKTVTLFLGGIIAGWTNENIVAAVIAIILVFIIYLKINKRPTPTWLYSGLCGLIIGFLLMTLAPGNYVRYQITLQNNGLKDISQLTLIIGQLGTALSGILFYLSGIILLYLFIVILHKYHGKPNPRSLFFSLIFFMAAIIATLAMALSPVFPERAWFGIVIFIIVAIVSLYNNLDFDLKFIRSLRLVILSGATLIMFGYYVSGLRDLQKSKRIFDMREQTILEGKEEGIKDFTFEEAIRTKSRINNLYELTDDPTHWTNCFYARYYGIQSVRVIKVKAK